jgi:O-antigen ligase
MAEKDHFYIPESWYIQQFVEGGVIGGALFLAIMIVLFFTLVGKSPIL